MKTLVSGLSSKVNIATHILWGMLESESTKCMYQITVTPLFCFVIEDNDKMGRNNGSQVLSIVMGKKTNK